MAARLLLAISVLCIAGPAAAGFKYPPGPPYRTCPDSLTIFDIQQFDTLAAPCHPATLDTVLGVRGVITCFDAKASAFGFYMQNTFSDGAHPWTGVDVFTGATNYKAFVPGTPSLGNLAVGDSVVVYGTTQEFPGSGAGNGLGETEIEGPDAIQTSNDIIIRKINSGNALPPYHIGTTSDFNWIPLVSSLTAEPWEGCLVRIRGPLHVARTQQGAGVSFGTFLAVADATPADSIMIDGTTLTTITIPTVGTPLDSVQGVPNQRTSSSATGTVNSYRIQLTKASDMFGAFPPAVTNAFFIEDDQVLVLFDRPVTQFTGTDPSKYSLGSFGSIDSVKMVSADSSQAVVYVTSGYTECTKGEVVTVNGVKSKSSGVAMTTAANITMVTGVVPIHCIEDPDPAFLGGTCEDRSNYAGTGTTAGQNVSFRGVCTGIYPSLYYVEDQLSVNRNGVSIFGPAQALERGHQYLVVGQTQEFGNETEIVFTPYVVDEGNVGEPAALVKPVKTLKDLTCDATQSLDTGEDYEGMLVKIERVRITENRGLGQSFFVAGPCCTFPDTILVSNLNGALNSYDSPDSASTLDVTGVLHITAGTYRICPRNASDIVNYGVNVGVGPGLPSQVQFAVNSNPSRSPRVVFTLPKRDQVDLSVFDLQGRHLATLARGVMEGGTYDREWNGRLDGGGRVGPGVYFFRLRVGGSAYSLRAVRLN